MPKTVALKNPLDTHDGPKSEIVLRDPIGADYAALGKLPFSIKGEGDAREVVPDFALGMKWLSRLSGIDEVLLGKMAGPAFFSVNMTMNMFLMEAGDAPGN